MTLIPSKMRKLYAYSMFLICLFSCNESRKQTDDNCPVLKPLSDTELISDLAPYIDDVIFECLPDNIYFSDLNKLLINENGDAIFHDMKGQMLLYPIHGDSLQIIVNRGRAANEYISSHDIAISNDFLLLLDDTNVRCFNLYSTEVAPIMIPIDYPYDAIAPGKDGNVFLFSAYSMKPQDNTKQKDNLLHLRDINGKILEEYINREDCTFTIGNISQSYDNRYYLRPQNNLHVFYELTGDDIIPAFRLDFGEQNIPDRYFYNDAGEDIGKYMLSPYYKLPMDLHHTSDHMFFHCCGPEASDINFIYDESGKGVRWQSGASGYNVKILGSDKDYFYIIYNPNNVVDKNSDPMLGLLSEEFHNKVGDYSENVWLVKLKFTPFK